MVLLIRHLLTADLLFSETSWVRAKVQW